LDCALVVQFVVKLLARFRGGQGVIKTENTDARLDGLRLCDRRGERANERGGEDICLYLIFLVILPSLSRSLGPHPVCDGCGPVD